MFKTSIASGGSRSSSFGCARLAWLRTGSNASSTADTLRKRAPKISPERAPEDLKGRMRLLQLAKAERERRVVGASNARNFTAGFAGIRASRYGRGQPRLPHRQTSTGPRRPQEHAERSTVVERCKKKAFATGCPSSLAAVARIQRRTSSVRVAGAPGSSTRKQSTTPRRIFAWSAGLAALSISMKRSRVAG